MENCFSEMMKEIEDTRIHLYNILLSAHVTKRENIGSLTHTSDLVVRNMCDENVIKYVSLIFVQDSVNIRQPEKHQWNDSVLHDDKEN